jgi:hypothetical protein
MKKLFLSLFVAGALTFGLQSCGEDEVNPCDGVTCAAGEVCDNGDCVPDGTTTTCDVCGTYDGTADGAVQIALTGTDTTFTGLTVIAQVDENAAGNYDLGVDISALLGAPAGTLVPTVEGTLSGTTMTIDNETYSYQGIANIVLDGGVDFSADFASLTGALTLTGDASGNVTFQGAK